MRGKRGVNSREISKEMGFEREVHQMVRIDERDLQFILGVNAPI